jgi:hypothetical protein
MFASLALIAHAGSANAMLNCDGPYLQNGQGEVRTPYCEYDYLARVAASYGLNVSADQLSNNFNKHRKLLQAPRQHS